MNVSAWKQKDTWTGKEFTLLLLLEFIFVIVVVKYGVQSLYLSLFSNTLYSGTLTGLTIAIVLMTGLYFIALRPKNLSWKEVGVRSFSTKYWLKIPIWLLITIILSVAVVLLTSLLGNSVDNSKTESLQQNINLFTILIGIISAGVVSPVYEEIFYRGFIYRWLRVRLGMNWGIVISSLIFTIAHFPTLNAMPVNFINGVVFAWVYEKTGSAIPGMIVHGVFNTIAVLLTVTG
ncbi:CPBP family intramembrane glutamic endopeptidase [Bacillus sp. REN16]|jgi:membrane protease YdiL (CAAX protease family)|uniref:CPBP family intramembrane glutamic endopeptidase n=1 Tax=Bacillus sp. REN16 TaxID=2887296 RepID=UPI001E2C2FE7|nr:type II CAAX endopeptidase family protein [Bacillus sp. REN16]MCC3359588.1 CPBP family intramembrane metalloprotease [Bacillus sp. REN16]